MKKVKNLITVLLICGMILGLSVVSEAASAPKLSSESISILVGKTAKLTVKDAGEKKVTWSSSNKKVATVSSKGTIKAKKAGNASVTAKVGSKKLTCNVIVLNNAPFLSATEITLTPGKTFNLSVENAGNKTVKWKTDKKNIATVSSKGKVKGKKAGTAKITAQVGSKKLTCTVTVEDEPDDAIAQANYSKTVTNGTVCVSTGARYLGIFSPKVRVTNTGSNSIDVSMSYPAWHPVLINLKRGQSADVFLPPNRTTSINCCGWFMAGGRGTMTVSAVRCVNNIY